jgi:ElaB/YqjD/DUF883 family membrane-anchored ribosome-binding protein
MTIDAYVDEKRRLEESLRESREQLEVAVDDLKQVARESLDAGGSPRSASLSVVARCVRHRRVSRTAKQPRRLERLERSMTTEQRAIPLEKRAEEIVEQVRDQIDDLGQIFEGVDSKVRRLVTERPLAALGGMLLAGFLAGRIFSRL